MSKKSTLVCIFVKTPGYSAVKTRLGLVSNISEKLFKLSALSTAQEVNILMETEEGLSATWHIAERTKSAQASWPLLNRDKWFFSEQRGISLSERLNNAYESFFKDYDNIIFLAADTPLIETTHIQNCISSLDNSDFFLGPADDGGFYIFGGRKEVPESIWNNVSYSSNTTCEVLMEGLKEVGSIEVGESLSDIDFIEDVKHNISELEKRDNLNNYSKDLLDHLRMIIEYRVSYEDIV